MRNIPIADTIREAYSFTFTHLGAIIGLIWLPMTIVTVAGFFAEQRYYADAQAALAANDYASMGPAVLGLVIFMLAALLLYAMMYVPVTQLALGLRQGGTMAHFSFGPLEWRMFRSVLGLVALFLVPIFVLGIVSTLVAAPGMIDHGVGFAGGAGMAFSVYGVGILIVYAVLLFLALRFAFFLPAVVVSENKNPLARSWALSAGNFWRILAVAVAAMGPVVLLSMIAEKLLNGAGSMPEIDATATGMAIQMHAMRSNLPIAAGINFLVAPLTMGLAVGACVSAYRTLTANGA